MSVTDLGCNKRPCWRRMTEFFRHFNKSKTINKPQGLSKHLDDDISQGLEEWSKHQHTAESQRAKSVVLLKDQLERYEFELALRKMKQKADERNKKKQRRIESTDDVLPYELQPISAHWKTALSKIHTLNIPTAKSPTQSERCALSLTTDSLQTDEHQKIVGVPTTSSSSPTNADITQSMEEPKIQKLNADIPLTYVPPRQQNIGIGKTVFEQNQDAIISNASSTFVKKSSQGARVPKFFSKRHPTILPPNIQQNRRSAAFSNVSPTFTHKTDQDVKIAIVSPKFSNPQRKQIAEDSGYAPNASSSTTESSNISDISLEIDDLLKAGHLTDLLKEIMKDAEIAETSTEDASLDEASANLAAISRDDMHKYEKIILENTKRSLLTCQPTTEELTNWEKYERVNEFKYPKIKFSKGQVEIRTFCTSCLPRHWNKFCRLR